MHDVDSSSGCWIAAVLSPPPPPPRLPPPPLPPPPLHLMELKIKKGKFLLNPPWRRLACEHVGGNLSEGRMYQPRDVVENVANTADTKWQQVL